MKPEPILSTDTDHYNVNNPAEIERIIRELMESSGLVTVYASNGKDFVLSKVTHVDAMRGHFLMDSVSDALATEKILAGGNTTICASLEGVKIQFETGGLTSVLHEGRESWRMDWPRRLLRLQRREHYRLGASFVHPIRCLIPAAEGQMETTVMDISIGGVAVLAYEDGQILQAGQAFHGCRIALPDVAGEILVSLRVINAYDVRLKNGRKSHRAGCQFINLPASIETEIQRYILKTERERRSRYV